MNKRGWIKIVEAFVAILLVAVVLLIVVNKTGIGQKDISEQIHEVELSILREVQLNDSLRGKITKLEPEVIYWEDELFPAEVKVKINSRIPNYLNCKASICLMTSACEIGESVKTNIYSQSVTITGAKEEGGEYQESIYKQLKLFCWAK